MFKKLILIFIFITFSATTIFASNTNNEKIIFISVAGKTDVFWTNIHRLALAAAKDFNADLEIIYTNRNHIKALSIAKEISTRNNKPDYVIVVGEKLIASRSIPSLSSSGIKVFMYGELSPEEKLQIGEPREKYPNYIGKIAVDDYIAGYMSAKIMIKKAIEKKLYDKNGYINFLSLEGVRKTSFNTERIRGLNDVLKEYPEMRILQSVNTDWTASYAHYAVPKLLDRYSTYSIAGVWGANSALARGSSDVFIDKGKIPGINFVTAGTDWNKESVQSVSRGEVLGIAGGHVAIASWIITLIHDYHNGIDFDSSVYLNKVTIMDKKLADKFLKHFSGNDWDFIDYTKFSKAENKNLKEYDFSFLKILNNISD